jgi:hypothetical protein
LRKSVFALIAAAAAAPLLAPLSGQEAPPPGGLPTMGETIEVRTGFVRLMLPVEAPEPRAEELEVLWKGERQEITRVVGGPEATLELGIAVDQSASLYRSFEPLREAARNVVTGALRENDRIFVVGFDETARLLDAGQGDEVARVVESLPTRPFGYMTALFPVITDVVGRFQNVEARSALVIATDGCDSDLYPDSRAAAQAARERAIPVFLLMPDREACRRTQCESRPDGDWHCYTVPVSGATTPQEQLGILTGSTNERKKFLGAIEKQGGAGFVVKKPKDWETALREILARLSRQWLVVFDPSSDAVRSDEVEVFSIADGKRRRLR